MTAPPNPSSSVTQRKFFFSAFGAWCLLCFLGQVTVPPHWGGGDCKGVGGRVVPSSGLICTRKTCGFRGGGVRGGPPLLLRLSAVLIHPCQRPSEGEAHLGQVFVVGRDQDLTEVDLREIGGECAGEAVGAPASRPPRSPLHDAASRSGPCWFHGGISGAPRCARDEWSGRSIAPHPPPPRARQGMARPAGVRAGNNPLVALRTRAGVRVSVRGGVPALPPTPPPLLLFGGGGLGWGGGAQKRGCAFALAGAGCTGR